MAHSPSTDREPQVAAASIVLTAVRDTHAAVASLEVDQLRLATEWALLHPGDVVDTTVPWHERELQVAGDGAPTVAEFAIPDLALALGLSTDSGRAYLGQAVELRFRLPQLWQQVLAGRLPAWKDRRVAAATLSLPMDGAAYVDAHLSPTAHTCTLAQLERTVEAARVRFDPEAAEAERIAALDRRGVDIHLERVGHDGVVDVVASLELADALDLDDALDLTDRELTLYVHLRECDDHVAEVEETRSIVSVEQVKEWCTTAGTFVTIRPVIDLNADLHTDRYQPTPLQHEQATLANPTCVYPGCGRPSRRVDLDHVIEHAIGGPTESHNLAPLCRGHHRLKTHSAWSVVRTGPTSFAWTSPHGWVYLRERPLG